MKAGDFKNDSFPALFFPKYKQPPSPAALSVNRESRAIALKRYRLCFCKPNIYADLSIDVLYFGFRSSMPFDHLFDSVLFDSETGISVTGPPPPEVLAELELVQRVGFKYEEGWATYDNMMGRSGADWDKGGGSQLREDLRYFTGLKELLLSSSVEPNMHGPDVDEPRVIILEGHVIRSLPDYEDEGYNPWDRLPQQRCGQSSERIQKSRYFVRGN